MFIAIGIALIILILIIILRDKNNNIVSGPDNAILRKYNDELEINPNNANAYLEIARDNITSYPKPYDNDKALADISKAIELDPTLIEAYKLRAMLYYYTIKDTQKALKDVDKILELEPNDEFALDIKKDIIKYND